MIIERKERVCVHVCACVRVCVCIDRSSIPITYTSMKGEDGEFCLRQDLRQIIAVKARIQCVAVDERAAFIFKNNKSGKYRAEQKEQNRAENRGQGKRKQCHDTLPPFYRSHTSKYPARWSSSWSRS